MLEETNIEGRDAELMKIKREMKKGKLVSSMGGSECNVIRVRLTVD